MARHGLPAYVKQVTFILHSKTSLRRLKRLADIIRPASGDLKGQLGIFLTRNCYINDVIMDLLKIFRDDNPNEPTNVYGGDDEKEVDVDHEGPEVLGEAYAKQRHPSHLGQPLTGLSSGLV